MPLTKKDLLQINTIVQTHVENLAEIVSRGFENVDKRFEQIDKRFEEINAQIEHINARLATIEHDTSDIRKHLVQRDEFEEVLTRLSAVERKLGIRRSKTMTP